MGYILFSSKEEISIQALSPRWNGIIEYSYDNKKWEEWYGEKITTNNIYMRGSNNTVINRGCAWHIQGKNVKCQGNMENLLDYRSVINNIHPKMNNFCFANMFCDCEALIEAPSLLSNYTSISCYFYMFHNCTSLIISPMFPNLTIAKKAIINQHMLDNCSIQQININNKLYDINVLKLL